MAQPEAFVSEGEEHIWLKTIISMLECSFVDAHLKKIGFIKSNNDPCIYFKV